MSFKERNLKVIRARHPHLLKTAESSALNGSLNIETFISKSGSPVFRCGSSSFHSAYKPEEEGRKFALAVPEGVSDLWAFGLGYGYHIKELLKSFDKVAVVEPSPEIFASAVENADIAEILEKCEVIVGSVPDEKIYSSNLGSAILLPHRPYLRFFEREFNRLETSFTVRSFLSKRPLKAMLISPIYGGSETTYRYALRALEKLGVETVPFDATGFASAFFQLEGFTKNQVHLSQLRSLFTNMLSESIVANADQEKPDLIIAMAQAPLDVGAINRLKQLKIPTAFWFVEDFRTLKYWENVAPHYDYFFTIQRGEFFEKLAKVGARNAAYLPQAASPDVMRPLDIAGEDKEKYGSDLSFMGAGYKNRQEFFQGLLDYDFKIWGTEWNLSTPVGGKVQNRNERLSPEEYAKIFCASKINLNLHSSSMLSGIDPVGDFVNPRLFELAACGAFQLVDNRAELQPLMEPGKDVETFSSLAELREKIDYFLQNAEERNKITCSGREKALLYHTFERRMEEMLRVIIENEGSSLGKNGGEQTYTSPNIVGKMIEQAKDRPELVDFLKQFEPDKPLSMEKVMDAISQGEGELSRVESIFQMINQLTSKK